MSDSTIIDANGRLIGTRLTVYHLMPYFLDASHTENDVARLNCLTPEQVAAARTFAFEHADVVLARHSEIEEQNSAGNSPEVIARMKQTHERFVAFREWLEGRKSQSPSSPVETRISQGMDLIPTFKEWLEAHPPSAASGK